MSDKISNIIRIALLVLGVIVAVLFYTAIGGHTEEEVAQLGQTDLIMNFTKVLLGIAVVVAIIAPIIIMARNPKNAKGVLLGIVVLAILFFIAYFVAIDSIQSDAMQKHEVAQNTSKLVGTGIILTYILAGLALVLSALSGLTRMFK